MKKIVLGCLLLFFTATVTNAAKSTPKNNHEIGVKLHKHQIELGDITDKSDDDIKNLILTGFQGIREDELECEITLHGSVKAFFLTIEFSITVKGPCNEMIEKGINVSGLVWAAVKAKLMSF